MNKATIAELLCTAEVHLSTISATPRLDAEVLLAHALAKPRSHLHAWPQKLPNTDQARCFAALLAQRLAGAPVAYLTGQREFWSLELRVTPATLIPRPETELLVELALARTPQDQPMRVADLGTGSGAIALAIAKERPRAQVVATDCSAAALTIAEDNARRLAIGNVEFRQGDWYSALSDECFALIVSNPPYLAVTDPHLDQGDLRFEPRLALAGGEDGLDAMRTLIAQAMPYLYPNGGLLLEHGFDQGASVPALLRAHGFGAVTDYRDMAGISRVSGGYRPVS